VDPSPGALICPKCESPWRSYERNGITVDQCTGCGGVFLDRGELETLIAAEEAHYGGESGEGKKKGFVGRIRGRAEQQVQKQRQRERGGDEGEGGMGTFLGDMFGG